jgi:hypothetical protein
VRLFECVRAKERLSSAGVSARKPASSSSMARERQALLGQRGGGRGPGQARGMVGVPGLALRRILGRQIGRQTGEQLLRAARGGHRASQRQEGERRALQARGSARVARVDLLGIGDGEPAVALARLFAAGFRQRLPQRVRVGAQRRETQAQRPEQRPQTGFVDAGDHGGARMRVGADRP